MPCRMGEMYFVSSNLPLQRGICGRGDGESVLTMAGRKIVQDTQVIHEQ